MCRGGIWMDNAFNGQRMLKTEKEGRNDHREDSFMCRGLVTDCWCCRAVWLHVCSLQIWYKSIWLKVWKTANPSILFKIILIVCNYFVLWLPCNARKSLSNMHNKYLEYTYANTYNQHSTTEQNPLLEFLCCTWKPWSQLFAGIIAYVAQVWGRIFKGII